MNNDMNLITDKIYELAEQEKYDEARKYIAELDISVNEKARMNMRIWQLQRESVDSKGKGFDKLPMTPIISMILGIILICASFFFENKLQTVLVWSGLIMAAAIPGIYCYIERCKINSSSGRYEIESKRYVKEGANINYVKPSPPAWVIVLTCSGAGLLIGALAVINVLSGAAEKLAQSAMLLAAIVMFLICSINRKRHNAVTTLKLISLSALLYTIYSIGAYFDTAHAKYYCLIFCSFASLPMILYPLAFAFIKRRQCKVKVTAECVDCAINSRRYPHRHMPPWNNSFWKYEYDGVTYVHKDMASYKQTLFGETTEIFIDPRDPHNIYRKQVPTSSTFYIFAGIVLSVYSFMSFLA